MDIFDLSAKITLDSSEFEKGVNDASGAMDGLSAKAVAIGNALYDIGKSAVTAFGELSRKAVDSYADYEQLVGGIDTLFKESSGQLQEYAEMAFETAGLSANKYMETATSFAASLVSGLGGDTAAAVEYANMAITDMADNANKMGTAVESIQNAYQGFAKQNYSMLDNLKLGYGGTAKEMYRLLETAAELDSSFDAVFSLDAKGHLEAEFADIVEAIHIVQEEMGITGTTALEASETISGSVATMKGAWENWLAGLGNANADMSGLTNNLIDSAQTAWSNIEPTMAAIKSNLLSVFTDLTGIDLSGITSKFSEFSGGLNQSLAPIIDSLQSGGFTAAFDTLLGSIRDLTGIDLSMFTGGIKAILSALDGLKDAGISGALENLIGRFEDITGLDLGTIKEKFGEFGEVIDKVITSFAEGGLETALGTLKSQLDNLTGLDVSGFFGAIGDAYNDIVALFEEGGIKRVFEGLTDVFKDAGPKILEFGKGILDSIGQLLLDIGQKIYDFMPENIQNLIDSIGNFFRALWGYLQALWEKIQPFIEIIAVNLVESLKTAWNTIKVLFNTLVDGLSALLDFLAAQFDWIVALWQGDFEKAAQALKDAWNAVLAFFESIGRGVVGIFDGVVDYFKNIGARMWEGLKSGLSQAIEGVKDIAADITEGFKNFFGIHSPSRVFAEFGAFMAEGLGKGWNSEIDSVVDKMSRSVAVHGSVDFASSSLGKSSSAQINTMLAGMQEQGGSYNINLVVDGRTLANVVFDPLNEVSKQKGVALSA